MRLPVCPPPPPSPSRVCGRKKAETKRRSFFFFCESSFFNRFYSFCAPRFSLRISSAVRVRALIDWIDLESRVVLVRISPRDDLPAPSSSLPCTENVKHTTHTLSTLSLSLTPHSPHSPVSLSRVLCVSVTIAHDGSLRRSPRCRARRRATARARTSSLHGWPMGTPAISAAIVICSSGLVSGRPPRFMPRKTLG